MQNVKTIRVELNNNNNNKMFYSLRYALIVFVTFSKDASQFAVCILYVYMTGAV